VHKDFRGRNAPHHERIEHYNSTVKRSHVCSKIWKEDNDGELHGSGKCISCYLIDDGANHISFRRLSAFSIIHLAWYRLVQATDRDGRPQFHERDTKWANRGDPILEKVLEEELMDKFSKRQMEREGWERVFGHRLHWSLGSDHFRQLIGKVNELQGECHCGGAISTPIWECRGCGREVIDTEASDFDLSKKQLKSITSRPYHCKKCDTAAPLLPVRDCDSCKSPKPVRIWDVDLQVSRQGGQDERRTTLSFHKHRVCDLDERCEKLVPERPTLHRIFAPDPIENQAKVMKVRNPWSDDDSRRHLQDRDDTKDDPADDEDIPF